MKNVAIVGIQGVPAQYGGFETLVENLIDKKISPNFRYTVYCSSKKCLEQLRFYKNAILRYVPLQANGIQSVLYDIISLLKAVRDSDVILVLGVSGCIFLPVYRLFFNKYLLINIDGLEHRRDKWGWFAKIFLKFSERMAVRYADIIIADNKAIQDYILSEYKKKSVLIAYGGDHVLCNISDISDTVLQSFFLTGVDYSFSVCRIEPENNIHLILEAFRLSGMNIVFVGNWNQSEYGRNLLNEYSHYVNIRLLSPIYDIRTLNVLRSHCKFYIHGHSAGGTNPSLVEAMFFSKPILAFDVIYNRETTEGKAFYFNSVSSLINLLSESNENYTCSAKSMLEIAMRRYRWDFVVTQYELLYKIN